MRVQAPERGEKLFYALVSEIVAGEVRYIGKETHGKWEEGDDTSILEFAAMEYGRKGKVIADEGVKTASSKIRNINVPGRVYLIERTLLEN